MSLCQTMKNKYSEIGDVFGYSTTHPLPFLLSALINIGMLHKGSGEHFLCIKITIEMDNYKHLVCTC